jgi:NAD(P)-dependent dehydrogenase (short-subunit alcohol dehydrogenase family)
MPTLLNLFDFKDKVVLVTGSGKGLGQGIALAFAGAGATLALHYRSSRAEAEGTAAQIQGAGQAAQLFQADLSLEEEVDGLFARVEQALGGLDVLINNAGSYPSTDFVAMAASEWDQVVDSNLRSVFLASRAAARHMIRQHRQGVIINIATVEGVFPARGHAHYAAAKAGVLMLTRSCALELGQDGIRVNAVSPGLIEREGIEQAWPEGVKRWMSAAPLKRLGTPQDVANACLFLASPAAGWITGVNLVVDGGISCRPAF